MKKLLLSAIVLTLLVHGGCSFGTGADASPEPSPLINQPTAEPNVQGPGGLLPPTN